MDQRFFADIVKEVLVREGKVCLPGLGCFVTEEVPASFSDKGFTINPPYRKLCFRTDVQEDMSLVDFYSVSNDISIPRAKGIITDYVKNLSAELYSTKQVELPGLGRLRVIRGNEVFFISDEDLAIFPQYDCLEAVSLRHLSAPAAPAVPSAPVVELTPATQVVEEVPAISAEEDAPIAEEVPAISAEEDAPVVEEVPAVSAEEDAPVVEEVPAVSAGEETPEVVETAVVAQETVPEAPAAEEAPVVEETPAEVETPAAPRRKMSGFGIFVLVVVILAILFFGAIAVLGRFYPDLIDPYLYSPEELKILHTNL